MRIQLDYDGSLDGWLSCVFHVFKHKLDDVSFLRNGAGTQDLFASTEQVVTDVNNAQRVWDRLARITTPNWRNVMLYSFYSEQEGVEEWMLHSVRKAFAHGKRHIPIQASATQSNHTVNLGIDETGMVPGDDDSCPTGPRIHQLDASYPEHKEKHLELKTSTAERDALGRDDQLGVDRGGTLSRKRNSNHTNTTKQVEATTTLPAQRSTTAQDPKSTQNSDRSLDKQGHLGAWQKRRFNFGSSRTGDPKQSVRYDLSDYGDPIELRLHQLKKSVFREKHRMEAFIRFHKTKDDLYYANCEPDFNVLPLIAGHFKDRYADQRWLIYDLKRNYGIYYDLNECLEVNLEAATRIDNSTNHTELLTQDEPEYQSMWNSYFKSVNIASRTNMRLHLQHVPRRYWKYLSEKR